MNQALVGSLYRPFMLVRVSSWIGFLYGRQETIHELTRNKLEHFRPQSAWTREERAGR
ncbi:MAG: hypothetical protein QOG23_2343 [Blastocatellia bacterium]|jgi:hypothetical protein|nr:hypothetical protein [Blastocatellia bacterium]